MIIHEILWIDTLVEKLEVKHNVSIEEVEYILKGRPRCRMIENGKVEGEHVYAAMGQTSTGRYLVIFFILKNLGRVLPISARDMDFKERRIYGRK